MGTCCSTINETDSTHGSRKGSQENEKEKPADYVETATSRVGALPPKKSKTQHEPEVPSYGEEITDSTTETSKEDEKSTKSKSFSKKDDSKESKDDFVLSHPEKAIHLLTGNVRKFECPLTVKVIVCLFGISKELCPELDDLHTTIKDSLEKTLHDKGIELVILNFDLNDLYPCGKIAVDVVIKFLLGEHNRNIICPVFYMTESLGNLNAPNYITKGHFVSISEAVEKQSGKLLSSWYTENSLCDGSMRISKNFITSGMNAFNKTYATSREEYVRLGKALHSSISNDLREKYLYYPIEKIAEDLKTQLKNEDIVFLRRTMKNVPSGVEAKNYVVEEDHKPRIDNIRRKLKVKEENCLEFSPSWDDFNSKKYSIEFCEKVASLVEKNICDRNKKFENEMTEYGLDNSLVKELSIHSERCLSLLISEKCTDKIAKEIEKYIKSDSKKALVLRSECSEKLSILMSAAITNCYDWLEGHSPRILFRFIGLSDASSLTDNLFHFLFEQSRLLYDDYGLTWLRGNSIESFHNTMKLASENKPMLLFLDGISFLPDINKFESIANIELPPHVKVILTCQNSINIPHQEIILESFPEFSTKEVFKERMIKEKIPLAVIEKISKEHNSSSVFKSMVQFKLCSLKNKLNNKSNNIIQDLFAVLESIFMKEAVQTCMASLSILTGGLSHCELESIFMYYLKNYHISSKETVRLLIHLRYFLTCRVENGIRLYKWADESILTAATSLFVEQKIDKYKKIIKEIFMNDLSKPISELYKLNKLKAIRCVQVGGTLDSSLLLKPEWLVFAVQMCGPFTILHQINSALNENPNQGDLVAVKEAIILSKTTSLNNPIEIISQVYERLDELKCSSRLMNGLKSALPTPSLMCSPQCLASSFEQLKPVITGTSSINGIFTMKNNPSHVITVAEDIGEVVVWKVKPLEKVRSLKGINLPKKVLSIDDENFIVLCGRELRIYNLDNGILVRQLRELMNQKTSFFGLYDNEHLVSLSRSRMYVNLIYLKEDKCVTTFKVGESRFLNSLMVSDNGKMCVCGDDSKSPSSICVWNLETRQLLNDLKIPNHDFATRLIGITTEGHYLCCVSKEIDEPGPNFVVVYDLKSGTMFKRWKPGSNTVSIAISSEGTCVVAGLENSSIMAYDLIVGNTRWTAYGHDFPVDTLKIDQKGSVLVSYDSTGKDGTVRSWDLKTGISLGSYTPDQKILSCTISLEGDVIFMSIDGSTKLYKLCFHPERKISPEYTIFGNKENTGKEYDFGLARV